MQRLVVRDRRLVAQGIVELTLADANGKLLPGAQAGAHIDVHLPQGLVRAYSLLTPSQGGTTDHYSIAVALSDQSRGGARYVHAHCHVGCELQAGLPRNLFPLHDDPAPVLLVAGGIGITPLLSMARQRQQQGRGWRMVYAARSSAHAAYLDALSGLGGTWTTHFDDEHAGQPLDVQGYLQGLDPATHLYCCGPQAMMDKVRAVALAQGHPAQRLHFESFGAVTKDSASTDRAFEVYLAKQGLRLMVPASQSVLEALAQSDVIVPSVCLEGVCGSCECRVLEGEVEHRDQLLSEAERQAGKSMMVCVSRAKGDRIVLDL